MAVRVDLAMVNTHLPIELEAVPSIGDVVISSSGYGYEVTSNPFWREYIDPNLGMRPNVVVQVKELGLCSPYI